MSPKYLYSVLLLSLGIFLVPAALAQPVSPSEVKTAFEFYRQHKYAMASASFEKIIKRQPTASYCYHAALANQADRQGTRARQLFQFVVTTFPNSQEAAYSKQVLGAPQSAVTSSVDSGSSLQGMPESMKALIPPEMQKMMNTPAGKQALADAMKMNESKMATIRKADNAGLLNSGKMADAVSAATGGARSVFAATAGRPSGVPTSPGASVSTPGQIKDYPFTAQDIAKTGAAAIDQMRYPNCWFEASMAALAELPRGQKLIASMIRGKGSDYVVRFPGDGVEYVITTADLNKTGIHDSALWASLIECAQTRKFPDNAGANGSEGDQSRLEIGLRCITGKNAEVIGSVSSCSPQELSSFIGSAIKSQNPIVAATYPSFPGLPAIAVSRHAYTIIDFDPSRNMITLRNPHGKNGASFALSSDPKHLDFEQLDDGVFKMSIRTFQSYFYTVCRSFI